MLPASGREAREGIETNYSLSVKNRISDGANISINATDDFRSMAGAQREDAAWEQGWDGIENCRIGWMPGFV
jgi:hypothetical protein